MACGYLRGSGPNAAELAAAFYAYRPRFEIVAASLRLPQFKRVKE